MFRMIRRARGGPETSYGKGSDRSGRLRRRKYRWLAVRIFGRGGRIRPTLVVAARLVGSCRRHGRDRGADGKPILDRIAARPGRGDRSGAAIAANPNGRKGQPERGAATDFRDRYTQWRSRPALFARHGSGAWARFRDRHGRAAKSAHGAAAGRFRASHGIFCDILSRNVFSRSAPFSIGRTIFDGAESLPYPG